MKKIKNEFIEEKDASFDIALNDSIRKKLESSINESDKSLEERSLEKKKEIMS